ncbi:MAG: protein-L-isoaspartate O-methyltransferase [Dongiaceae bacterium]
MDFAAARFNMVESQIRTNRVIDPPLLDAFASLPRERFVPPPYRSRAYVDEDVPLGGGRCLMEPMVLGRLLQIAAVEPGDTVLVVGGATGYAAAVLARLAASVVALESDKALLAQAGQALAELGIDNVSLVEGRLTEGCPRQAPYNVILIDGAVEFVPQPILDQLAEGGRLVTVLGQGAPRRATLMERIGGTVSSRPLFEAAVAPLPGFSRDPGFIF